MSTFFPPETDGIDAKKDNSQDCHRHAQGVSNLQSSTDHDAYSENCHHDAQPDPRAHLFSEKQST